MAEMRELVFCAIIHSVRFSLFDEKSSSGIAKYFLFQNTSLGIFVISILVEGIAVFLCLINLLLLLYLQSQFMVFFYSCVLSIVIQESNST